jgi:hypothetical protein
MRGRHRCGRPRRTPGQQCRVILGEIVDSLLAQFIRKARHHRRGAPALAEVTPLRNEGGFRLSFKQRQRRVSGFVGRVAGDAARGGEPFPGCRVAGRRAMR